MKLLQRQLQLLVVLNHCSLSAVICNAVKNLNTNHFVVDRLWDHTGGLEVEYYKCVLPPERVSSLIHLTKYRNVLALAEYRVAVGILV